MNVGRIHVVLSNGGTYRDVVEYLVRQGAGMSVISPDPDYKGIMTKWTIVRELLSTKAVGLRRRWKREDTVLVIGWQALPVLALMKVGVLLRPQRCVVMGCFVHSPALRKVVDRLLRSLRFPGLGFIAFSRGERGNLIESLGVREEDVLLHLWRQDLYGKVSPEYLVRGEYVFSGGYTNRDYNGLLKAAEKHAWPLMIVASSHNEIDGSLCKRADILRDLDEEVFEGRLAGSALVVLPLKSAGEACGQSVLLRVLRNRKALIANRHESIEDYLGKDYPGFVKAGDPEALAAAVTRAFENEEFYQELIRAVSVAQDRMEKWLSPGEEVFAFLASPVLGSALPN